jgi:hypothetical protein
VASFANLFLQFIAMLKTLLYCDLAPEIDVLEGFEIFAGFSESFFDWGL